MIAPAAWAQVDPADPSIQPEYEILQQRSDRLLVVLPNRLIVVVQELHTAPVVAVQARVKTGSIFEQEHVGAGLSHFLEHLVSGGSTDQRAESQNNAILGRIGARTNAWTSLDQVGYYVNATSTYAADAIDLLSDWLQHCRIDQDEYARERDVIQREIEMGLGDPRRIFWKLTQQVRYLAHPARHPTIGYLDEFENVTRDEIYHFYKKMYVPNNMVFVVVGDIDKQAVVDQIARLWADTEPGELPALSFPIEPTMTEPRQLRGRADIKRPRLRLVWPGTQLAGEGDYALDLLAVILGQGESSRLVRTVRDEHRAVNRIDAFNSSFAWGRGMFGVDAEVAEIRRQGAVDEPGESADAAGPSQPGEPLALDDALAMTRDLILEQVHRVIARGISESELALAKRQIMADVIYSGQSADALAGRIARDVVGMGDPDYMHRYARRIEAMTSDDVAAAADQFLRPERMITVTLLPADGETIKPMTRAPGPGAAPAVTEPLAAEPIDLDNLTLIRRLRDTVADVDAGAAPIAADAVQMYVMPTGLRLLIGRSTLVPAVAIQMYQRGGLLADSPGREGVTKTVAAMRIRGTTTRSAQDIARQIEGLGAALSTDSGYNTSFTTARCLKEDFDTVLELFADVVVNPSFDDGEWQKMKPRLLAAIDRQTDQWYGELRQHFRRAYFAEHPWGHTALGRGEVVEQLTSDDLIEYYAQRISAADSVLAVFGDIDPAYVRQRVEKLFNDLPASAQVPFQAAMPPLPAPTLQQVQTDKPLGAVQVGFGPGATRASQDYAAVQVLERVLGRWPTGWLAQALRGEGEGLVYYVGCRQFAGLVPGYVGVGLNASPDKLTEAIQRAAAVIQRARTELVDDKTLEYAKVSVITNKVFGQQSNADRAAKYALDEIYDLGPNEAENFMAQVQQLDAQTLRIVAQTYLQNPVTVVLSNKQLPQEALTESAAGFGQTNAP